MRECQFEHNFVYQLSHDKNIYVDTELAVYHLTSSYHIYFTISN